MQFFPFEEGIQVNGQTVYAIVDGFKAFKSLASKFLLTNNVGTKGEDGQVIIEPQAWYSHADWLSAFQQIAKEVGGGVLNQIGRAIPKNAQFPPWVEDIDSAIKSIDIAYHMNHRKNEKVMFDLDNGEMSEGIGHYGYERIDGKNLILSECTNPYPCDFDCGIITTMATMFELKAKVVHDDSKPCRKNGANSCTYIISW